MGETDGKTDGGRERQRAKEGTIGRGMKRVKRGTDEEERGENKEEK